MAKRLAVLDPEAESHELFRQAGDAAGCEVVCPRSAEELVAGDLGHDIAVVAPDAFSDPALRRDFVTASTQDSVFFLFARDGDLGAIGADERARLGGLAKKPIDGALAGAYVDELCRRHSEQMHREAALSAIPDLFFRFSPDGRFTECQPRDHRALKHSPEEFLGRPIAEFTSRDQADAALAAIRRALRTGETQSITASVDYEDRAETRHYEARLAPSGDGEVVALVRDITDLARAHADLERVVERKQALTSRILHLQETERRTIARELHDAVGQMLLVHKLDAERLRAGAPDDETRAACAALARGLDESLGQVRALARGLRPPALDDFGLSTALEALARDLTRNAADEIRIASRVPDEELSPDLAITIYRIAQEAITNAIKHGGCARVWLTLARSPAGELELRVEDDGVGISEARARDRQSLGLLGMHERAALHGGEARVEARAAGGTTVLARIPEIDHAPSEERAPL